LVSDCQRGLAGRVRNSHVTARLGSLGFGRAAIELAGGAAFSGPKPWVFKCC
jgi:hypothetical protein